ncbi:hypothetical protein DFJ73DRAFT_654518 [Zopfochytrium polystomum]|nr:hypothetical protein DFJ73DRAFT_654518 [Zopfochytrium polystomum]
MSSALGNVYAVIGAMSRATNSALRAARRSNTGSRLLGASAVASVLAAYLLLVRFLRHRRIAALLAKYPDPTRLTLQAAREILLAAALYEFPFTAKATTQLALFRTYGIPSISKLLAATGQLCDPAARARRYADTELAIAEWTYEPSDSVRANTAIARVNWLHEHYKKHIDRDAMVFTLSVFVTESKPFFDEFEWRRGTDIEKEAAARVWHEVGLKMGIADPPRTFDEFQKANKDIQERLMRFHPDNKVVADASLALFLGGFPAPVRPPLRAVLVALIDPPLRDALGLETPAPALVAAVRAALRARAWFVRNFMLPRVFPHVETFRGRGGRLFRKDATVAVYIQPTVWNRWGPAAWAARLFGAPVPGDEGTAPKGCDVETELGPVRFEGVGVEEVRERTRELVEGRYRADVWK